MEDWELYKLRLQQERRRLVEEVAMIDRRRAELEEQILGLNLAIDILKRPSP